MLLSGAQGSRRVNLLVLGGKFWVGKYLVEGTTPWELEKPTERAASQKT